MQTQNFSAMSWVLLEVNGNPAKGPRGKANRPQVPLENAEGQTQVSVLRAEQQQQRKIKQ